MPTTENASYQQTRPLLRGRTPITPAMIDEANQNFKTAAMNTRTAPTYHIFESGSSSRSATLRASIETPNPSRLVRMSLTSGEMDKSQNEMPTQRIIKTDRQRQNENIENITKAMPQLKLYSNSYNQQGNTDMRAVKKKGKKKHVSPSNSSSILPVGGIMSDCTLMAKTDESTRYMLRKTQSIMDETKRFIGKTSKKIPKKSFQADQEVTTYDDDFLFEDGGMYPPTWTRATADGGVDDNGCMFPELGDTSRPTTSTSSRTSEPSSPTRQRPYSQEGSGRPNSSSNSGLHRGQSFGSFADLKLPKLVEETVDSQENYEEEEESSVEVELEGSSQPSASIHEEGSVVRTVSTAPSKNFEMTFLPTDLNRDASDSMMGSSLTASLPTGWTSRRVNNVELVDSARSSVQENESFAKSRSQWENELARHILSLYATTQVSSNQTTAKVVLDYVDVKGTVDGTYKELTEEKPIKSNSTRTIESRKETIANLIKKMEEKDAEEAESAKFRVSTKVITKDGREVVIRGTPKVFPIWFTSSGDIYSDWTLLSGGEKLQAHLKDMYDNYMFDCLSTP